MVSAAHRAENRVSLPSSFLSLQSPVQTQAGDLQHSCPPPAGPHQVETSSSLSLSLSPVLTVFSFQSGRRRRDQASAELPSLGSPRPHHSHHARHSDHSQRGDRQRSGQGLQRGLHQPHRLATSPPDTADSGRDSVHHEVSRGQEGSASAILTRFSLLSGSVVLTPTNGPAGPPPPLPLPTNSVSVSMVEVKEDGKEFEPESKRIKLDMAALGH